MVFFAAVKSSMLLVDPSLSTDSSLVLVAVVTITRSLLLVYLTRLVIRTAMTSR